MIDPRTQVLSTNTHPPNTTFTLISVSMSAIFSWAGITVLSHWKRSQFHCRSRSRPNWSRIWSAIESGLSSAFSFPDTEERKGVEWQFCISLELAWALSATDRAVSVLNWPEDFTPQHPSGSFDDQQEMFPVSPVALEETFSSHFHQQTASGRSQHRPKHHSNIVKLINKEKSKGEIKQLKYKTYQKTDLVLSCPIIGLIFLEPIRSQRHRKDIWTKGFGKLFPDRKIIFKCKK